VLAADAAPYLTTYPTQSLENDDATNR
jgi:hypothetical protein